ncbi:hypothetical protein TWF506_005443 [Arthrobotrys conoides]|uniref:Uncharacterized protein n=1 Tax=Arthrobotrys conoides TaxID=74498 RepID=A0AAN8NTK6_9PEZI
MNLLLLAALGLSTVSQTALAVSIKAPIIEAEPVRVPISAPVKPGRDIVIKTKIPIEKNPDRELMVDVSYTPDYSFEGRANLTFSEHNPPRAPVIPFKMMFLCPDCPIAIATPTLGGGSDIGHRVFTPFTLQEASYPVKKSNKLKLSIRVRFIAPRKPRVSADYAILFYRGTRLAFQYKYEKRIPPGHPINYIVLQNQRGGEEWGDMVYKISNPRKEAGQDESEGDDIIDIPDKSKAPTPKEYKGGDEGDDEKKPEEKPGKDEDDKKAED